MIKILGTLIALLFVGCGTDNSVDGGTTNTMEITAEPIVIEHRVPICENEEIFDTEESIIACIEAVKTTTIEVEELTEEQIEILQGVINGQENQETN